ncbi:MAG: permease-like cell division protein FtsX [Bacteroidota bacterium]|nr:permease-like cell division protein FtsX [Bacteroidota bacterium]
MAVFYILKEGFSGFKRARLSSIISIFTMTISLLLLGLFVIIYRNTNQFIQAFRDKVEMEVFLSAEVTDSLSAGMKMQFLNMPGIVSASYISKDDAAKIFKKEFGEDITAVLDFNPLPASFKLKFASDYKNSDSAKVIHDALMKIRGVDDVVYRKALLEILDRRVKTFVGASAAIGLTLLIAAIFLVSNTIRLTIYAKRKMITTMKLVGATRGFIRMPFLIEGMLQGFIGGALAAGLIYGIIFAAQHFVGNDLSEFFTVEIYFYAAMILFGIFLGLIGSGWSVKRFISEKIVMG